MRVYEIAKEFGVPNKELLALIRSMGLEVNNHMSDMDPDAVARIRRKLEARSAERSTREIDEEPRPVGPSLFDRFASLFRSAPKAPSVEHRRATGADSSVPPTRPGTDTSGTARSNDEETGRASRVFVRARAAPSPTTDDGSTARSRFEAELERARARTQARANTPDSRQAERPAPTTGHAATQESRATTPPTSTQATSAALLIVDGINVARWRSRAEPDLAIVLAVCQALQHAKRDFYCCFDANTPHELKAQRPHYDRLLAEAPEHFGQVPGGTRADDYILQMAHMEEGIVLSQDLFKDYRHKYPWIAAHDAPGNPSRTSSRLIRGQLMRGKALVPDLGLGVIVPPASDLPKLVEAVLSAKTAS